MTEWISVEERLPEEDDHDREGWVLVRLDLSQPYHRIGRVCETSGDRWMVLGFQCSVDSVTHWMPLPAAPDAPATASTPLTPSVPTLSGGEGTTGQPRRLDGELRHPNGAELWANPGAPAWVQAVCSEVAARDEEEIAHWFPILGRALLLAAKGES